MGRGARGVIVGRGEQLGQIRRRAARERDVDHRAHEKPHHAVQEPIRFNRKIHTRPVRSRRPLGERHAASVVGFRGAGRRQTAEVVLPDERLRGLLELHEVERSTQGPLVGMPERRATRRVGPDHVPIATRRRAAPGVEPGAHGVNVLHPDVSRQQSIQCATQGRGLILPSLIGTETYPLPDGVDPGIGPSSTRDRRPAAHEPLQHRLEFRLHGASRGLTLPADELPSVVLHHGEEGTARHQHKIGKRVGPFQAT